MALPSPKFYTTGDVEITTHDFGSVEAGAYKPDATGWKFRLWNDKDGSLGSDDMTSVKISVRDDDGGTDEVWTQQHWVQIKSSSGSTGVVDDAMTVFQAVGKNKELSLGDIPSDEYRTLYARCYPPTDATEQGVEFQLKVTYQQPATSICKWITGLRGNGVVASTGDPFAMSTGGSTGTIPYEAGYALIYNNEIYYGSSGTYDCSTGSSGANSVYLNESGAFGMTTGDVDENQLKLYEATISSGVCTALSDKRVYLAGLQSGTTGAMPITPDLGDLYLDITNGIIYGAKTSTGWTALGATTFIGLTDTPVSMSTGDANDFVVVNAGGTALEFSPSTGFALDGWGTPSTGTSLNATTGHHGLLLKGDADTTHYLAGDISWTSTTGIVLDSLGTPSTGTALNSSTGRHGLLIALDGSTGNYLRGDGSWATPPDTDTDTFLGLSDTPVDFSGDANKILRVDSSSGAVEFVSSTGLALDGFGTPSTGTTLDTTTGRHGLCPVLNNNDATWLDGKGNFTAPTASEVGAATTGVKLDDWATPDDNTDLNATTGYHGLLLKLTGSTSTYLNADGSWSTPPGATGGEANTASNVNTTGVGVYEGKVGVELQFKGVRAGSSKATVTDTTGTHTISVDINSTGILLDSLGTPSTGTSLNATTGIHGLLPVGDGDTTHYLAGDINWISTTGIVLDSLATPTTGTALNSSTGRHGLLIALDGSTGNYLRGDGSWQTPPDTDTNTFVGLTDTPASYTGHGLEILQVNAGSNAVEFSGKIIEEAALTDDENDVPTSHVVYYFCETTKDYKGKNYYSALGDDHTYSDNADTDSQPVGESVVFGDLLYFDWTDKEWKKTDADAAATMPGLRIALESKTDGQTCLMLVKGYIRDDSAFESTGAMVYASPTAGGVTSIAPSSSGQQVQRVGVAKSADILFFDPSIDVGEI